jgi:hypothetical protein
MLGHAGPPGSSPGGLRTIPELIALAVNVAHSSGVAEVCAGTILCFVAPSGLPCCMLRLGGGALHLAFEATACAALLPQVAPVFLDVNRGD